MDAKRLVPFVSNDTLIKAVGLVVDAGEKALGEAEQNLDVNILDPFSALFEMALHGISYDDWLIREKVRQTQKTMQNAIGDFHQTLIGGIDNWEDLGVGDVADVRNKKLKIVAEVKNKHNTVTGQHLVRIYDELQNALLKPEYNDYQAYYVMMIAKKRDHVKCFTPSDNHTSTRRPKNEKIKEISGWLFYDIATGVKGSLFILYSALPKVLEETFGYQVNRTATDAILKQMFDRTYKE